MEGKIDENGVLEIKRAGKMQAMNCKPGGIAIGGISENFEIEACCGDSCPLFGEPSSVNKKDARVILIICQGRVLAFDKFTDERRKK